MAGTPGAQPAHRARLRRRYVGAAVLLGPGPRTDGAGRGADLPRAAGRALSGGGDARRTDPARGDPRISHCERRRHGDRLGTGEDGRVERDPARVGRDHPGVLPVRFQPGPAAQAGAACRSDRGDFVHRRGDRRSPPDRRTVVRGDAVRGAIARDRPGDIARHLLGGGARLGLWTGRGADPCAGRIYCFYLGGYAWLVRLWRACLALHRGGGRPDHRRVPPRHSRHRRTRPETEAAA